MPQDFERVIVDRQKIEDEIERLIGLLDALVTDPDLEPSLGWTEMEARYGRHPDALDDDLELDESDDEPSLGSPEASFIGPSCGSSVKLRLARNLHPEIWKGSEHERTASASQATWARGCTDDREDQCEDEGFECDTEEDRNA